MAGNNSNHGMTWSTADIPSLTGRVAVATGANSGIGWQAWVDSTVRSEDKGRTAVESIRQLLPRATIEKLFKK